MENDLPLSLPVKPIIDHFTCPVCCFLVKDTHMTPCGHKFCEGCIKECINRRHKCPCCNGVVAVEQLVRDHQHDELLSIVLREKETAEKKYFESLIESATTAAFTEPQATKHCSANRLFDLSPIEAVLRKHLKKTLVAYEEYLVKLKQDCIRSQEECCLEERKRNQSLGVEAETKVDYEHQKELIRQQFDSCATMLAESYDQYLSEQLVPPSLVPVNVSMTMAGRGTTFHLIKVLPSDSTVELRETLTSLLESRGEKVISVEQAQFVLIG
jgi:hypothetical protein